MGEAIRLMEMSKDSLKAAPATSRGQQEVDRIYQFILSIAEGSKTVKVQDIRDTSDCICAKKKRFVINSSLSKSWHFLFSYLSVV